MDTSITVVAIALAVVVLLVLIVKFSFWLQWFRRELRYLNKEIARTEGKEKEKWIKQKKKLYLSILPFIK